VNIVYGLVVRKEKKKHLRIEVVSKTRADRKKK